MNAANFKAGDKVRIIPKNGNTNIRYNEGEYDTVKTITEKSALIVYFGSDANGEDDSEIAQDWWELDELVHYTGESQDETAKLRMRNMELEAALEVTTESLNKANYEKYLLEVAIKEAIEKSIPKDTTLGDCAWALINCRETLQNALKEKQAPVSSDSDSSDEQASEAPKFKAKQLVKSTAPDDNENEIGCVTKIIRDEDGEFAYDVQFSINGYEYRYQEWELIAVVPAPTAQAASEAPKPRVWYTVKERVDTMYKTDEYSGKRYPSDYSVFIVVGPNGKAVDSFSALTHGLEDAEFLANELRDKLNKAV